MNAPVETRHTSEAQLHYHNDESIIRHAQTLANLEAANNRLAEIDRIAVKAGWSDDSPLMPHYAVATLASGHTPFPCPGCAAKDEAMGAFKADLSDTLIAFYGGYEYSRGEDLSRFIIPPTDPVAEALKAAVQEAWDDPIPTEESTVDVITRGLMTNLAKHGLELSRLGGAK